MKPAVAMPVVVHGYEANGTKSHAGTVTHVWGEGDPHQGDQVRINATIFPDGEDKPMPVPSVLIFADQDEALAYKQATGEPYVAWFPEF